RPAPLAARKEALGKLMAGQSGAVRFGDHVDADGEGFYKQACDFGLEGIVCKRGDLPYRAGRTKDWLKVKCLKRQEFVIVGFTDPEGSRAGFGALLLAVHEGKDLVYAGKVGTGYTERTLLDLRRKMDKLAVDKPAFKNPPRGAEARRSHWVKPQDVVRERPKELPPEAEPKKPIKKPAAKKKGAVKIKKGSKPAVHPAPEE